MASGLPVIASPVGMNQEVVKDNVNGFLAASESEWMASFEKYIVNKVLREKHGIEGRRIVENKYCLQMTKEKLLKVIQG